MTFRLSVERSTETIGFQHHQAVADKHRQHKNDRKQVTEKNDFKRMHCRRNMPGRGIHRRRKHGHDQHHQNAPGGAGHRARS